MASRIQGKESKLLHPPEERRESRVFDLRANPWTVLEADFPVTGPPTEQLQFLLSYAVLAPSEYNTQPWLFNVTNRTAQLYADRSRRLPRLDPDDRELTISCGAAFLNLRLALRHFGYADEVEMHSHDDASDLLARVSLGRRQRATREEHELFHAILQRRTNRQVFEDRRVPSALLSTLQEIAGREGVWFQAVQEVLLRARAEEIWASFVNQPIEVPSLRTALREILGRRDFPKIVLRMGYGPEVAPTPRRSVSEVLL